MAEAREQDTGMDMIPGYERPTRSAVVDTAEQNVTICECDTRRTRRVIVRYFTSSPAAGTAIE